jgi:integrase
MKAASEQSEGHTKRTAPLLTKKEAAAEPRVRPMIQFLIFTGMRKGEMAHLEWMDIKWLRRQIHIQPKMAGLSARN